MKAKSALSLALAAGIASTAAANNTPIQLDATEGNVKHAGHIYFNVATGEKISTLIAADAQRPVDGEAGTEIWTATTGAPCADFGDTTSFFFGLDDPTGTGTFDLNAIVIDWGDIENNTVVDCVQIHWITNHQDTDTDMDSFADGIEGFAGTWTYWDGMNGRSPQLNSIALPIIQFTFFSLQGELSDPGDSFVSFFTADIDLGSTGSFGTSLIFEIGDTDSDLQGAAAHNARMDLNDFDSDSIPDIDPDGDGLADWGWSLQYNQPGTVDVDNADSDSDTTTGIDGDPAALATAGIVFGSPTPGFAEFDSVAGAWNWVSDGPTAGATEDGFGLGVTGNPDGTGTLTVSGPFFFGGFDCTIDVLEDYTPPSHFQVILYGPAGCGPDLNGDDVLDFFDVSFFLAEQVDYNGDTIFDFFDVSAFLADFGDGCPG